MEFHSLLSHLSVSGVAEGTDGVCGEERHGEERWRGKLDLISLWYAVSVFSRWSTFDNLQRRQSATAVFSVTVVRSDETQHAVHFVFVLFFVKQY